MNKPAADRDLETRLADVELQIGQIVADMSFARAELTQASQRFAELQRSYLWLRKRLAQFYPERMYCPQCRTLITPTTEQCPSCKKRLRPPPDPKVGLPKDEESLP